MNLIIIVMILNMNDSVRYKIQKLFRLIPDKEYITLMYLYHHKRYPDLRNPKLFSEKINWLKLYDHNPKYQNMVDKIEVKEYVKSIIGEKYVIETLKIWMSLEKIDISALPDSFVIKCNHDGQSTIICKNKNNFDLEFAKNFLKIHMKRNAYWHGREFPYKNIKPKIFAEKYLGNIGTNDQIYDYKFFCFNGKVKCFKVDFDRFTNHRANYYSREGELLPFGECICPPDHKREKLIPDNLNEMIEISERLAINIPFIRIDLYNYNGKIYFGEMTFYPASGFGRFIDLKHDFEMGKLLALPDFIN